MISSTKTSDAKGHLSWEKFILQALVLSAVLMTSCRAPEAEPLPMDPPKITSPSRPVEKRAPVVTRSDNIEIGDELELFVEEDPSFNGKYQVREKGDIILPRLGRVAVKGDSVAKVEGRIKVLLQENQLREATVIVDRVARAPLPTPVAGPGSGADGGRMVNEPPRMLAYFTGSVKRPGQHWITLPRGQPVGIYEAILITGGLARFAHGRKVEVLRKNDDGTTQRMTLDVDAVKKGEAPDPPLYEGDIVFVPEKRVSL